MIGADGRRSTIPGFDRKELRGKLALAITANFINYFTREEAGVEEISGVAFIFNQKFFKVGCGEGKRGREGVMRGRGFDEGERGCGEGGGCVVSGGEDVGDSEWQVRGVGGRVGE